MGNEHVSIPWLGRAMAHFLYLTPHQMEEPGNLEPAIKNVTGLNCLRGSVLPWKKRRGFRKGASAQKYGDAGGPHRRNILDNGSLNPMPSFAESERGGSSTAAFVPRKV